MTAKNKTVQWVRLGDYIEEKDERNLDLLVTLSQGISNTKVFQDPKQVSADSKSDKIVRKGYFAYNRATTRNGEKISIAYRIGEDCTVSSAYCVFRIKQEELLNPNFLWLWFSRPEFDRYARYMSKGSAHEFFDWEELCRVQIPLPSLEVQRELVDTYTGLQRLAEDNEALIAPLTEACQAFIVDCQKKYPMVKLGDYIKECDERNTERKYLEKDCVGVNIDKELNPMRGNLESKKFELFKLVFHGYFVYNPRGSRKLGLGFNGSSNIYITTFNNVTFQVTSSALMSEYLYILLSRKEFDRNAEFRSWGSSTEVFSWSALCETIIPLPPLEVQESIVNLYHCIEEARKIARKARAQLQNLCPALIQYAEHN